MAEPTGVIQDQVVAVQLARIEEKMSGMKAANEIQTKQLDSIQKALLEVTRLSERFSGQDDSVKQIWDELNKRDEKWDQRFGNLDSNHTGTRDKINRIFWFSTGVGTVASILLGLVLWVVSNEMKKTERHDSRLDAIEIHLAADQIRPYRPR